MTDRTQQQITLGVLSDTHGWLDPELIDIFQTRSVEHILHAGDVGEMAVLEALEAVAPVTVVRGNIDGGALRDLPLEATLTVRKRTIAVLHIAGSPKRPNRTARGLLQRLCPDVLLVGHSHIPVVARVQGALWINPGAAGRQGFHTERFAALLHIGPEGELSLDRIHLGPRGRVVEGPA
ncbi:MAG: metallophosphoesterase family protein [Myxococcota bacterium]